MDWTIDADPEFQGHLAGVITGPGSSLLKTQVGEVGGALLSEIRQRGNGAGASTVNFPRGFAWDWVAGEERPPDGTTITNTRTWIVRITDVGNWDTVHAIEAEVGPP